MQKQTLNNSQKKEIIEKSIATILSTLGLNLKDASIKDTPKRVARMYVEEIFAGLSTVPPNMTTFPNKKKGSQMVLAKDISINSYCEHHLVPFIGTVHIAYIPGTELLGLSKFARAAKYFASKPQLQERLTDEIADFLKKQLNTEDVAVVMNCKHFCMCTRGVKDENATTITSSMNGAFRNTALRAELLTLIKL